MIDKSSRGLVPDSYSGELTVAEQEKTKTLNPTDSKLSLRIIEN